MKTLIARLEKILFAGLFIRVGPSHMQFESLER